AMRRGRGPGRNRVASVPGRSWVLAVDECILVLLVSAAAPGAGSRARPWGCLPSGGAVVLVLDLLLHRLAGAVDQRPREEQGEEPPWEGVCQVWAQRGVRLGQGLRARALGILGRELPVRTGGHRAAQLGQLGGDLLGADRVDLPLGVLAARDD